MPAEQLLELQQMLDFLELQGIRPGLEVTRSLLDRLGGAHLATPSVLIAGTNGKGSVASLLSAMSVAAGYRTGLFTSPHLETVCERIRVDGRGIEPLVLVERLRTVVEASRQARGRSATYFESLTVAAFQHFAASSAELAVLEVGLGGRLDSTNVAQPVLSLLTPISLDHTHLLGETVAEIAVEKAGILRTGVSALSAPQKAEALEALVAAAAQVGTRLVEAKDRVSIEAVETAGLDGQRVCLRGRRRYELQLRMPGGHQVETLRLAVAAVEELGSWGFENLATPGVIEAGVESCRWPGRLEVVVLPDGRKVVLDGAHNTDGSRALVACLESMNQTFDLLCGLVKGKSIEGVLAPLVARATSVTLCRPPSSRGVPVDELVAALDRAHQVSPLRSVLPELRQVDDPLQAAAEALARSSADLLLVAGSLYLVGEVRAWLTERFGVPQPAVDLA